MKIPSYIDIYYKGRKLKVGAECPKELEAQVQKAIDQTMAKAKKQGEHLAPYDDEEKVIQSCAQYPEYCDEVRQSYVGSRKAKVKVPTKEKAKK
jgi:hypothetical protein